MKADLHVHSKYSTRPSEWVLRKLGCSESYTEPSYIYNVARQKGMDLVTITDHNTLTGSLEIAHLPGTFVSEEITTYFPEDRCKLHVLAYNIDEAIHNEISRLRENVFDLVAYLNSQQVIHALAHPLFSINDKLSEEHFCQAILLFRCFEMNGSRDNYQNKMLRVILESITEKDITLLAAKYDLPPVGDHPHFKTIIGGSDDHSSLDIARVFTEIPSVSSVESFLHGIYRPGAEVIGDGSNPKNMAQNIYSIAYQFYKNKFQLERYVGKDLLMRFVDRALVPQIGNEKGFFAKMRGVFSYRMAASNGQNNHKSMFNTLSIKDLLLKEAREIIIDDPQIKNLLKLTGENPWENEDIWFHFMNRISEKVLRQFADSTLFNFSGADLFNIFHGLGSAGCLYTILAPFFVSYKLFMKDRQFARDMRDRFDKRSRPLPKEHLRVAHFTDTLNEVNGVALTLKMESQIALKHEKFLKMITCGLERTEPGITNFTPTGVFEMPEYPALKLYYPPLLEMLNYCYQENFTHIHSATPGPLGIAALIISRILQIPIYGTYHTALPQYTSTLTGDFALEEMMWRYSVWYYNQMDAVYVPSRATGKELAGKGVHKEKIVFYPRGIDVERFHPSKRNGFFRKRLDLEDKDQKLLYVGRVSREKNLPFLAQAFKKLTEIRKGVHLVIVGDGPYMQEMKQELMGWPASFTGYLDGEDLAQAYASSDIFVFPSTTDTFGNVVLEAQASGIPVIVTNEGGPQENLIPEKTGFILSGNDTNAWVQTVAGLLNDPARLESMKIEARRYMNDRSFDTAFLALWNSYSHFTTHRYHGK
ncbi:MAG: glycosyltransferase [Deltaproteobacteria bacterium]|nr:glycosyltransferase [Deltaproteobacteria bacterium]